MTTVPVTTFRPSPTLRVTPWHGQGDTVVLGPNPGTIPTRIQIERTLADLSSRGVRRVFTPALGPAERAAFLTVGFTIHEHLHLLRHDLQRLPHRSPSTGDGGFALRRGTARHVDDVLRLDNRAFVGFWQFDARALTDARAATPHHRFRLAMTRPPDDALPQPVGYAVTGRARHTAYLQRLAVDPTAQGRGIGSLLVLDALRWSARRGADDLLVNTQADNEGALRLYLRLGFTAERDGLDVLVWSA